MCNCRDQNAKKKKNLDKFEVYIWSFTSQTLNLKFWNHFEILKSFFGDNKTLYLKL